MQRDYECALIILPLSVKRVAGLRLHDLCLLSTSAVALVFGFLCARCPAASVRSHACWFLRERSLLSSLPRPSLLVRLRCPRDHVHCRLRVRHRRLPCRPAPRLHHGAALHLLSVLCHQAYPIFRERCPVSDLHRLPPCRHRRLRGKEMSSLLLRVRPST